MASFDERSRDVLLRMIRKLDGRQPGTLVDALGSNHKLSMTGSITGETTDLPGYLFFVYLMRHSHVIEEIPVNVWHVTRKSFFEAWSRMFTFTKYNKYLVQTKYFPHVQVIAAKFGFNPKDICPFYDEFVKKTAQSQKAAHDQAKDGVGRARALGKHRQPGRDFHGIFCTGREAYLRGGKHNVIVGTSHGHNLCDDCGQVLSRTMAPDAIFDDNDVVVKTSAMEVAKLPKVRRYNFLRAKDENNKVIDEPLIREAHRLPRHKGKHRSKHQGKDQHRSKHQGPNEEDQVTMYKMSALMKHRQTFQEALDAFQTKATNTQHFFNTHLSAALKAMLLDFFDMSIEAGFTPSVRLSIKIIALGYTLWKLTTPMEQHYLDFRFSVEQVFYLALDKQASNPSNPKLYLPPTRVMSVKFQPHTDHCATDCIQRLRALVKAASTTPNSTFDIGLSMYGPKVAYQVESCTEDKLTLMPKLLTCKVDIGFKVVLVAEHGQEANLPDMTLHHQGAQCQLLSAVRCRKHTKNGKEVPVIESVFFIEGLAPNNKRNVVRLGFSNHMSIMAHTIDSFAVRTTKTKIQLSGTNGTNGTKTRIYIRLQACPLPLTFARLEHKVNHYLHDPIYSPSRGKASLDDAMQAQPHTQSKASMTSMTAMPSTQVDESDDEDEDEEAQPTKPTKRKQAFASTFPKSKALCQQVQTMADESSEEEEDEF